MEQRRRLYDYLTNIHLEHMHAGPIDNQEMRRVVNRVGKWRRTISTKRQPQQTKPAPTFNLREFEFGSTQDLDSTSPLDDGDDSFITPNLRNHKKKYKLELEGSTVLMSLPLELQFMILENYFDASHHSTLASVCKLWNHIMKNSKTARAKRYIEYDNKPDTSSITAPTMTPIVDIPKKLKIHMALLMDKSQQYFFKDSTKNDPSAAPTTDFSRFGLKGPFPGLTMFAEDPIVIFPDQSSGTNCKVGDKKGTKTTNSSIEGEKDPADVNRFCFSQEFVYKYQTTGMFPSLLGAGFHGSARRITLTTESTVGDYTKALVGQMKELAKSARERRCSELTRSTHDKQVISLWERLTATDGQFLVQVDNSFMFYEGYLLNLTPCEKMPSDFHQDNLLLDSEINFLDLNVLPPSRLFTRHPFSDSEDD
ncbi:hypothetical protein TWF481_000751 [Arthrobotrys musiformis]|uniref:F-box domain-containing protein n=1 Tax=Arthrobotrys musiformis TaxID=47236 RepID=A0AAV9WNH4_9PEZI